MCIKSIKFCSHSLKLNETIFLLKLSNQSVRLYSNQSSSARSFLRLITNSSSCSKHQRCLLNSNSTTSPFLNSSKKGISYSSYNYNLYPNSNSFTKNFVASEQEKQQQQRAFSSTSKSRSSRMPPISGDPIQDYVEKLLNENKIVVFSKTTCPWCVKVKQLFKELNEEFVSVELDKIENGDEIKNYLIKETKQTTVPNVFINGNHVGGFDNTSKLHKEGRLAKMLNSNDKKISNSEVVAPKPGESAETFVNNLVKSNDVVIFSKTTCPFCVKVKELFKSINRDYVSVELDEINDGPLIRDYLFERTGQKTVPNVYVKGVHIGGCDNTITAHTEGRLAKLFNPEVQAEEEKYDYDLVVIGGGSGGLACSKMAADLGAKAAVFDFVKPTPIGTTWGLGGTCVNVGCIPKKLMHQSALLGEALHDSKEYGWQTPDGIQHNWEVMRESIQNYIGSLNFGYRVALRDKKVDYINGYAEFVDKHKLKATLKNGNTKDFTAKNIVIAVGGRPKYPDDLKGGIEHCITSDDLFSLPYSPGKTLCVGASYVSLECAGFLKGIGLDVTVMVRSILLRGFDQQMANMIGSYMESHGINFVKGSVPVEITRIKEGQPGELLVKYKNENGEIHEEVYNTVILAVGREPCTKDLNLDRVGVKLNPKNKKIRTTFEQTNVENIYAIGDVIDESSANGRVLELTPVAIKAGQLLAKRLFGESDLKMDYNTVPTTVFTPLEYGSIGFSEEEAIEVFGQENIEVYHQSYWPLEWTVAHKPHDVCYAKLICNKADRERVVGFHVAGPNAGEITQGYAVAMKLRATKQDFDMTVGIHPTCSETFTTLTITKNSGKKAVGAGC